MVYMRASLFGLFLQHSNLTDRNSSLYNWFYYIYFLHPYLLLYVCAHDTIFNTSFLTRIYRYTCAYLCTPLGIHHTTYWRVLTPLDLHVQILKLGACGFFLLLIRDAQKKRRSSADYLEPHPFRPPARLSSFLL